MDPARKIPTLADLEALPPGIKGEIIEGVLYTMTRPRSRQRHLSTAIVATLFEPFDLGEGGPAGWRVLHHPGIELPNTPEISPDIAGWRRERMPEITNAPDWVCEILSPTTRRHDLLIKRPYYAKIGVPHHWLADVEARTLSAFVLREGHWVELGIWSEEREARVPPFDAVALDVSRWCS